MLKIGHSNPMKRLLLQVIAIWLFTLSAHGQKMSPGNYFPEITLPSVATDKPTDFKTYTGQKMMLHIFASW